MDNIEEKVPVVTKDMLDLTRKVIELKTKHAELKVESGKIWAEKQQLEEKLIDQMEVLNLQNFRHKELGLISVGQRIWAVIADREKAQKFFDQEGITDQILENRLKKEGGQKRLNEIVKEHIENGKMVPEGLDFSSRTMIRVSKG